MRTLIVFTNQNNDLDNTGIIVHILNDFWTPAETLEDSSATKTKVVAFACYLESGHTEYIEYSTGFPVLDAQSISNTYMSLTITNAENDNFYANSNHDHIIKVKSPFFKIVKWLLIVYK